MTKLQDANLSLLLDNFSLFTYFKITNISYQLDLEHMRTFQELKYTDMRDENNQLLDINTVTVIKDSTVKKYNDQGNFDSLSDNQNFVILGALSVDSYEITNTDANIEPNGNAYSHGITLLIDDSKINQNLLNVESLVFYSVGQNEVGHYLFIDSKGIKL